MPKAHHTCLPRPSPGHARHPVPKSVVLHAQQVVLQSQGAGRVDGLGQFGGEVVTGRGRAKGLLHSGLQLPLHRLQLCLMASLLLRDLAGTVRWGGGHNMC